MDTQAEPYGPGAGSSGKPLVHDTYDWSQTSPIEGVTRTISAATGTSYADLDPLHNAVDTDGLVTLIDGGADPSVAVTFRYEGYAVAVHGSGDVLLYHG